MADIAELAASVSNYISEIEKIESVLLNCTDTEQIANLQDLKANIEQLLNLTYETLNHESTETVSEINPVDDEYSKFMSEIKGLENTDEQSTTSSSSLSSEKEEEATADDHLQTFIGKKCSAPFNHSHGVIYHNAFVCDVPKQGGSSSKDVKVNVMCLTPTQQKMLPCKYFLNNTCSYSDERCRFSHGESVLLEKLKDYVEPDFTLLTIPNSTVLAKQKNLVWAKGVVISVDLEEQTSKIKLEQNKVEITCGFADIFPIVDQRKRSDLDLDSDDEFGTAFNEQVISLSVLGDNCNFGEWEKYTNGMGSKLMKQMGYVVGRGLGSRAQGRLDPVTAQILPAGKSLDYCMQLREQAQGDENLFSVEKKLKKQQKRQETINQKQYERQQKDVSSVFSFLNDQILATTSAAAPAAQAKPAHKAEQKADFKDHTTKKLNIESLQLAETIKVKSKEMEKLRETFGRAKSGTPLFKSLNSQITQKQSELAALKSRESRLEKEQKIRRDKSKLTIF